MHKKWILLTILLTTIIFTTACKDQTEEVNEMLDSLNQATMTHRDSLISSMDPTFEVDNSKPQEKSRFHFEPMFSNGMVLQANTVFKFYGSYDTDGPIAVELNGKTYFSEVIDQSFTFYMGHYSYGGPYEMVIYTKESTYMFEDVMIGEVFLMSGQSNMAITLSQILKSANDIYTAKINDDALDVDDENIRFINVGMLGSSEPHQAFQNYQTFPWEVLSKDNALGFSAMAFYFARELNLQYDIPIGIIVSAVGATNTNTWIPEEDAQGMDQTYIKNISDADTPSRYYNGMIHPLRNYTFRGVIWYQGEGQHVAYEDNMTRLIQGWRRDFNDPELKFLIVELPRFDYELAYTQESWFSVRKQQQALTKIENVAYSVSIDLGILSSETNDPIHPFDKDKIGMRAAHAFMDAFYQAPGIWSSPKLMFAGYLDGKVTLKFSNVGEGIYLTDKKAGFEISTDGNTFTYVEPQLIDHETIVLNTNLQNIKVIRYGYTYHVPEIFGPSGLPGSLSDLVCVYNSGHYPLDQFLVYV